MPRHFFDEVYFNYKTEVYLRANISKKEFNLSNLKINILKKFSKKNNFPIILMNPFNSSKKSNLFDEIHIGLVQRYKKDKII